MRARGGYGASACRAATAVAAVHLAVVTPCIGQTAADPAAASRADLLLVVDCLLPGQVRNLGQRSTYLSARRPARLPARDCQIRGGEYVAYDRADLGSALAAWLPLAEQGDIEARVIVGEIHERGLGVAPDYEAAARWYRLAADAGDRRAMVNLGYLYERGLGVAADAGVALDWYRRAAGRDVPVDLDAAPVAVVSPPAVELPPPTSTGPPGAEAEIAFLRQQLAEREAAAVALEAGLSDARRAAHAQREALDEALRQAEAVRLEGGTDRARLDAALVRLGQATADLDRSTAQLAAREQDLAAARASIDKLGQELTAANALAASRQRRVEQLEQEAQRLQRGAAQRLVAGPELALVDPPLVQTRDIVPVAASQAAERTIVGRVTAPAGLVSLTVNDSAVPANDRGVFSATLSLGRDELPVRIVAVDSQGKRAELAFRMQRPRELPATAVAPRETVLPQVDFGRYHALIIGNDDYQQLTDLGSPQHDVSELARVLQQRYGFEVTVLRNATRYQILSALNALRETLTPRDNLLVYYAGHGELDEVNQRGYWLPVDAERDSNANWIPTTAVTDLLNILRANQVMLVVDSCYAGALTRSSVGRLRAGMTAEERLHWMRTMASRRARTVLTSGGLAPVMDAGGGKHSVFARALLEVLEANEDVLDGQHLHREVAARVAYAAANLAFDQVPEYAPIRHAGHEAGEFFLVPRRP